MKAFYTAFKIFIRISWSLRVPPSRGLKLHDEEAKQIGANGFSFVRDVLTEDVAERYIVEVLEAFAARSVATVNRSKRDDCERRKIVRER